jgi:hypothetical protein
VPRFFPDVLRSSMTKKVGEGRIERCWPKVSFADVIVEVCIDLVESVHQVIGSEWGLHFVGSIQNHRRHFGVHEKVLPRSQRTPNV